MHADDQREAQIQGARGKPVPVAKEKKACSCINFMYRASSTHMSTKKWSIGKTDSILGQKTDSLYNFTEEFVLIYISLRMDY